MADASASQPTWRPSHNPWLIAAAVMMATFMEVLDTSVKARLQQMQVALTA